MNEATMIAAVCKSWRKKQPNLWVIKFPDYFRPGAYYSNDRAVDTLICYFGQFVGIEWKIVKTKTAERFKATKIRDSQINALDAISKAGGVGLLIIVVYHDVTHKHLYVFTIDEWLNLVMREESGVVDLTKCNCQRSTSGTQWDWRKIEEVIDFEVKMRTDIGVKS